VKIQTLPRKTVARVNACALSLRTAPCVGPAVSRRITILTYTGRRSGRTFSIPVGYSRRGDTVTIIVQLPEAKTWWRNFTGEGAPLTLDLDGHPRPGHAIAYPQPHPQSRRVRVTVRLLS
jgi:hypothetical protein